MKSGRSELSALPAATSNSYHSATDNIADIRQSCHFQRMRFVTLSLLLLSACAVEVSEHCGEVFCMPPEAELLGKQEVEDFNLYQMEWGGERFGIYEGDFPDFDASNSEQVSIPIDADATLRINGQEGQILAHLGGDRPKFIHVIGPCSSRDDCSVVDAAAELSLRR